MCSTLPLSPGRHLYKFVLDDTHWIADPASPAWLRDAVVYQLSVRAFGGDFDGVRVRLGYLADLGVNTIWMMPIHPIGVPLYARGWDQDSGSLDAQGCLVAPLH